MATTLELEVAQLRDEVRRLEARHVSLSDQFVAHSQQKDHRPARIHEPGWWQTSGATDKLMAFMISVAILGLVVDLFRTLRPSPTS